MNLIDRVSEIDALIPVLKSPVLVAYLKQKSAEHAEALIASDSEQTRGRIKALRELINLPETLQYERDHIAAELTAKAASA